MDHVATDRHTCGEPDRQTDGLADSWADGLFGAPQRPQRHQTDRGVVSHPASCRLSACDQECENSLKK